MHIHAAPDVEAGAVMPCQATLGTDPGCALAGLDARAAAIVMRTVRNIVSPMLFLV